MECYVNLREKGTAINIHLSETWWRHYQVRELVCVVANELSCKKIGENLSQRNKTVVHLVRGCIRGYEAYCPLILSHSGIKCFFIRS